MVTINVSFLKRATLLQLMTLKIENKIINILKQKDNQNILEISKKLKLDRHTTSKYLEILKTKGLLKYETKGKSKIWQLTKNPFTNFLENDFLTKQVLEILNDLNYEISIQSKNHDVVWHNRSNIKGKCYQVIEGKDMRCKNCLAEKVFEKGETQKTIKKSQEKIFKPIKNQKGDVIAVMELVKGEK